MSGREIGYNEALDEAIVEEARRNPEVFVMGEDIAYKYRSLAALSNRVLSTPISEASFVGTGLGAALAGMRPVVYINFIDLAPLAMDQITNQIAKARYMSGGQLKACMVILVPEGASGTSAGHHSQSLEGWYIHIPGLIVAAPSTPYDAKGLMKTALRGEDPVFFIQHKSLRRIKGPVPTEDYTVPFGTARTVREGKDVTLVSWLNMVYKCVEAADRLEKEGISVEIIDPRTLVPFDEKTVLDSVRKTGRLVVVEEECKRGGAAAEVGLNVVEKAFYSLKAPVVRVAAKNSVIPYASVMEQYVLPQTQDIIKAVKDIVPL